MAVRSTDDGPKYKNTRRDAVYHKSTLLYGLHLGEGRDRRTRRGRDLRGLHRRDGVRLAGVPNAVATCGTALADEHFVTLKNLARKVTLAYDADAAGQAAAERCYQWEQRFEVQFQVADLPAGRDPGDLWHEDPGAFVEAVEGRHAVPPVPARPGARGAGPVDDRGQRARRRTRAAAIIAEHPNDFVRDQYVMRLPAARHCDHDAARLRSTTVTERVGVQSRDGRANGPRLRRAVVVDRRELDALRWAVHAPELIERRLHASLFADPLARMRSSVSRVGRGRLRRAGR